MVTVDLMAHGTDLWDLPSGYVSTSTSSDTTSE